MSDFNNFGCIKPEDLSLELFSLQLELNQVPYGGDSASINNKLTSAGMAAVSTTTTTAGHHLQHQGHIFDLTRYQHVDSMSEPMLIDPCNHDSFGFHGIGNSNNTQKSSDEGTVIDEDLMDVLQQSLADAANVYPIEVKPIDNSQNHILKACTIPSAISLSSPPLTSVSTPANSSKGPSPSGSYYGGHSSQGGPPTPPSGIAEGKKKKLKTRHARDTTYSQIQNNNPPGNFNPPYESPPTPATPTTTPISSCPGSPGSMSGYHSRESTKSTSSRGKAGDTEMGKVPRHKRPSHIKAEYKRRNKIQGGIEDLQKIVPTLSDTGGKESKSQVLNKAVDYCRQLVSETKHQRVEMERLRVEIESLRAEINCHQGVLPPTGAKNTQMKNLKTSSGEIAEAVANNNMTLTCQQMFNDYVNSRSLSNWKFWIFGLLIRPLFESYNTSVQMSTTEVFNQGVVSWCKQHCSLISLRPAIFVLTDMTQITRLPIESGSIEAVFSFLRSLTERTSIRTDPTKVPNEVVQTVIAENFPAPTQSTKSTNSLL